MSKSTRDGKAWFVATCEKLDAALRSKGYVLPVVEVEALVFAGLSATAELHSLPEAAAHMKGAARRALARA